MPAESSTSDGIRSLSAGVTWAELRSYFPNSRIGTYLKPLPDYDVLYVKNPKAACSTLLHWLDRIHTGDADFHPRNIHKEHRLPTIHEVGRRRVLRMISGSAYRFSFVRHPAKRLESVYWDKVVRKPRWRSKVQVLLELPPDPTKLISFAQFLDAIERQDPLELDPHWRPQHINLLRPLIKYDYIGKLEAFEADLRRIENEAGLPHVPMEPRNVAPQRPDRTSVYEGRPDLVRRVEALYAQDFELYDY
jgi:hypothetical protein